MFKFISDEESEIFKKASESGDLEGLTTKKFTVFMYNKTNNPSYKKVYETYKKASEGVEGVAQAPEGVEGVAQALRNIGNCYYYGSGVAQDYNKAYEHYKKAYELGDTKALVRIGYCYYHGKGVEKDYEKACEFYKKASELKDAEDFEETALAFIQLGDYYRDHGKFEYNRAPPSRMDEAYDKAFEYYKKASESEDSERVVRSLRNIGHCYYDGKGVRKNQNKAYEYYKKASELGDVVASRKIESFSESQVEKFEMILKIEKLEQRVNELETAILYAPPSIPNGGSGFQKAKENFESLASKMQNLDDETGPLD
jgi:TPR repeat protein